MSRKISLGLFLVIILALVGFAGFKYFQIHSNNQFNHSTSIKTNSPTTPLNESSIEKSSSSSARLIPASNNNPLTLKVSIESTNNGKIQGQLDISNNSDQIYADLYSDVSLDEPDTVVPVKASDGSSGSIGYASQIPLSTVEFTVPALQGHQNETVPFEISYSTDLPVSSYYRVVADLLTKPSINLAHNADTYITLVGSDNYLSVSNCQIIVDGKNNPPQEALAKAGSKVMGQCEVTNQGTQSVSVHYNLDYAQVQVYGYPDSQKTSQTSNQIITINPQEDKILSFPLPNESTPQLYEAQIVLVDTQGQYRSAPITFSWIISGPSARINQIALDQNSYHSGDKAQLTVSAFPSIDLVWGKGTALTNARLAVSIYDQSGQLCGQTSQILPTASSIYSWQSQQLSVDISRDCTNPTVESKILDGNLVLADFTKHTSTNPTNPIQPGLLQNLPFPYIVVLALIILITLIVIRRARKGTGPPPTPLAATLILIILASILMCFGSLHHIKTASAQRVVYPSSNPNRIEVYDTSPPSNQIGRVWGNYQGTNTGAFAPEMRGGGTFSITQVIGNRVDIHTYQEGDSHKYDYGTGANCPCSGHTYGMTFLWFEANVYGSNGQVISVPFTTPSYRSEFGGGGSNPGGYTRLCGPGHDGNPYSGDNSPLTPCPSNIIPYVSQAFPSNYNQTWEHDQQDMSFFFSSTLTSAAATFVLDDIDAKMNYSTYDKIKIAPGDTCDHMGTGGGQVYVCNYTRTMDPNNSDQYYGGGPEEGYDSKNAANSTSVSGPSCTNSGYNGSGVTVNWSSWNNATPQDPVETVSMSTDGGASYPYNISPLAALPSNQSPYDNSVLAVRVHDTSGSNYIYAYSPIHVDTFLRNLRSCASNIRVSPLCSGASGNFNVNGYPNWTFYCNAPGPDGSLSDRETVSGTDRGCSNASTDYKINPDGAPVNWTQSITLNQFGATFNPGQTIYIRTTAFDGTTSSPVAYTFPSSCYTACSQPPPSSECAGPYTDSQGYSCTGTKDCTAPDSATINGFPAPGKTCYKQTDFPASVSVSAHDDTYLQAITVHLYNASTNQKVKDYTANNCPTTQSCTTSISIPYSDLTPNQKYYLKVSATDSAGLTYDNPNLSGNFYSNPSCISAYINTTGGGDVHSNTNVNTPGGP